MYLLMGKVLGGLGALGMVSVMGPSYDRRSSAVFGFLIFVLNSVCVLRRHIGIIQFVF